MADAALDLHSSPTLARPPVTILIVLRGAISALLAAYFFVVFCVIRGMLGGVGWPVGTIIQAFGATAVMTGFVVWLAPIVELPEVWFQHRAPARRRSRGLCPECGYARPSDGKRPSRCPECGTLDEARAAWQFGGRTLRLFLMLALVAYLVGCGCAVWWIAQDESAFRRQATNARGAFARPRAWPADFAQLTADEDGAVDSQGLPNGSDIDPSWSPQH